ncbi:hypothetical protein ACIPPQ_20305 [Sphingopyxis sp. LARHCG72]
MTERLDSLNVDRNNFCLGERNDFARACAYPHAMVAPAHDWYLKEWLSTLRRKQADIVRDLDWNKARVSLMLRGEQPYTRDAVNELADYLNLRPYELLMHPDDAMALRRLREDALRIAAEGPRTSQPEAEVTHRGKTGTGGK